MTQRSLPGPLGPRAEWPVTVSLLLAGAVAIAAGLWLVSAPGRWWGGVALGGVAVAVLALRRRPAAEARTYLLVGNSPELAVLSGLLQSRQALRGGRPTRVERVRDLAEATARAAALTGVAVVVPDGTAAERILDAAGRPVAVSTELELIERLLGRVPLDLLRDEAWAAGRARPAGWYGAGKRAFDLGAAAALLVATAPLSAGVALALLLTGGRPVTVAVPCVGRDGAVFRLRLFRTCDGAASPLRRVAGSGWRRLLHDAHLDVLPALLNVLAGDLSLIGPRPEPVADAAEKARGLAHFGRRHAVKPGMASLAQVRFRYTDAPRDTRLALEYDLYYARHAGPALDARIFVGAVWLAAGDGLDCLARGVRRLRRRARRAGSATARALVSRPRAVASVALPRDLGARAGALTACLLVGAGEGGRLLAREMRSNPDWGLWPVGFVDDDLSKVGARIDRLPVLGTTSAIPAVVRREHVDAVVIAMPSAPALAVNRIVDLARQTPAQILTMPNLGQALRGKSAAVSLQTVRVTDVLGRPVVSPDVERCRAFIAGRTVLVTGAAGSIGSEVARQVAKLGPTLLLGLDINESDLFDLQQEMKTLAPEVAFRPVVASITNRRRIAAIFGAFRPEIVFHAAAYKHVPMMEEYPQEAVFSNTIGTYEIARAAAEFGIARFVLVSSDKAVRPSSVMGASKRLAELALRAVSEETGLSACAVRFGNVLGSRGSVIPIFERQIAAGGPVTITDPRMKRYFMTIPEAAGLIVQAGAFGDRNVIYMLDMGEPVAIKDLAERLIRLHGLRVGKDIEIVTTGLRPGEKLYEELALDFEAASPTPHGKIRILSEAPHAPSRPGSIEEAMRRLATVAAESTEPAEVRACVMELVMQADRVELRNLQDGQHKPYVAPATEPAKIFALQAG